MKVITYIFLHMPYFNWLMWDMNIIYILKLSTFHFKIDLFILNNNYACVCVCGSWGACGLHFAFRYQGREEDQG